MPNKIWRRVVEHGFIDYEVEGFVQLMSMLLYPRETWVAAAAMEKLTQEIVSSGI
jgi:hypothetical protein